MMGRLEHDSFGDIEVAHENLWGAQTQRSLQFFDISTERMPEEFIFALAEVKIACTLVNCELRLLEYHKAKYIVEAAREVLAGLHHKEFPLSVWQTGSGTQSNMNMNEVLANLASKLLGGEVGKMRLVHPNDDVNLGQSSNDIFPTAMHVAAAISVERKLLPALRQLRNSLTNKSMEYADVLKVGRTHLQDATPIKWEQEFSGYVAQLDYVKSAIVSSLASICELAVGGTAIGTGLNTHPEFGQRVAAKLATTMQMPFVSAHNKFAAIAAHDAMIGVHGALKTLAVALIKIANDIRWMASGPRSGLGEISIPNNEPGSSMMPGKVNPTQCEALTMLCCQVIGNDVAITFGGASGSFELNTYKPLIAHNFLQSVRLLSDGMTSFDLHCVRGIKANQLKVTKLMAQSLMLVTALVPYIGYERAAEIAQLAERKSCSLKQAALTLAYVTSDDFDNWVVPANMV